MKVFPVFATAMCMTASLMCLTFKEPILQLKMLEYKISTTSIGLIFSLDTVTFTITSLVLNMFNDKNKNFPLLVTTGVFVFVVSMLLCGPAPFLPQTLTVICIGILIGGIGGALVNNNSVPALNLLLRKKFPEMDPSLFKNNISAINVGAFGLGSILGPIMASLLKSSLSFGWAFTINGVVVAVIFVF